MARNEMLLFNYIRAILYYYGTGSIPVELILYISFGLLVVLLITAVDNIITNKKHNNKIYYLQQQTKYACHMPSTTTKK